jgi:hypothetical protein
MISECEPRSADAQPRGDLQSRHAALQRQMVAQLERTAAGENHWLIYLLLGWEHLAACIASYYLVEVLGWRYHPKRWPNLVVWLSWVVLAAATVHLIRIRSQAEKSPLASVVKRIWILFFLLCGNVVGLNLITGLPVFVFLPVLATLGTFAFAMLTMLLSRRFLAASLAMFATGIFIAYFPAYGLLIYGGSWLLVLQTLGILLYLSKRRLALTPDSARQAVSALPRSGVLSGQSDSVPRAPKGVTQ